MIRVLLLPAILATLISQNVLGQASGGESASVEFRVTRFDPGDNPSPEFRVGSGAERVDVTVPLTHIAGPHTARLRDGRFLDFWRGEAEAPEISIPIGENERKDLLLFFLPEGESFRVLKVSTPATRIRGGDRLLLNATDSRLAIKLGSGQPVMIDPGKSGLVRGPGGDDTVSLPVLISRLEEEQWKPSSTENWYIDPRIRSYLFAYISPRSRHLAFHVVTERL